MPLTLGIAVITLAALVAAASGVVLLARRGLYASRRLFALGVASAALGLAGTGVVVLASGGHREPIQLLPASAGACLSALLMLLGLVRLPGSARNAGDNNLLDGLVVAICGFYVAWSLAIEPAHATYLGHAPAWSLALECLVVGVPSVAALCVWGVACVVAWRVEPPKGRHLAVTAATAVAVAAGLAELVAIRYAGVALAVLCGIGYLAGLLAVVVTSGRLVSAPRHFAGPHPLPGGMIGVLPFFGALVATAVRLAVFHSIDMISVDVALVIGAVLGLRQAQTTTQIRRYATGFRDLANTDPLTGLPNRRRLLEVLDQQLPACSLLLIDLDGFKNVNDVRGHDAGDIVLIEVAERLRVLLGRSAFAARLGGDEFAVITAGSATTAEPTAYRLLRSLCEPYQIDGGPVFVSASIGLAGRVEGDDLTTLLRRADMSLRFAKRRGKNRVERYDAEDERWLRRHTTLEQDLRRAIERDELSVVYQPVVALPGGRLVGVEALLRWHHPQLGPVPPDEFIPIAEEAGLVGRLDRWVMHRTCDQLAAWVAQGHDLWASVNVSVRELSLVDYVESVVELLDAHQVSPCRLVLEVTEHAVALDIAEVAGRLAALRAVGLRVALDDFGAGYSSLGQLRDLPLDIIKIDRGLIEEPLLSVSVQLGHRLGLDVIAEGVAEPALRDAVEAAGCRLGQGSLFSSPVPPEEIGALLMRAPRPPEQRRAQHLGQVDSAHEIRQS